MTDLHEAKRQRAEAMASHVVALLRQNRIEVEHYTGGGRAFPQERRIRIRPVRGLSTYYVALHEIGHVVGNGRSAPKLEKEANAWAYAFDHAKFPPTRAVELMVRRMLRGYLARHERMSHRRRVRWPPDGHVFWKLAEVDPLWLHYDDGRTAPMLNYRNGNTLD